MSEITKTQNNIIQKNNTKQKTEKTISYQNTVIDSQTNNTVYDSFVKDLRKPRSKKKMKLYAKIDLPTLKDEEIIERMRQESQYMDQEEITKEDIEAYILAFHEEFSKMIQKEMEEEERKRKEEERREQERKKREEEKRKKKKIGVLSKCFITGCHVHFIPCATGWSGVEHYKENNVPSKFQTALSMYNNIPGCDTVEIFGGYLTALSGSGEVIKINETDFSE